MCAAATSVLDSDTLVVLDDVDVADDDPLVMFLEPLILGLPPRLHLVVACRTQPNLRIARLPRRRRGRPHRRRGPRRHPRRRRRFRARPGCSGRPCSTSSTPPAAGRSPCTSPSRSSRRGGPLDRAELIEHLLSPDAILFDYLAEDVLANLSDPERELLVLAASIPELSAALLDDIGCGDLAVHLARLTAQRIFLEPVLGRPDHVRTTVVGGAFLRRALPPPPANKLDEAIRALLRAGDVENALVLSARVGDPDRAREVLLAIEHPDWLASPDALEAALDVAERGDPHHRLTELRADLAYQRGRWDDALRLYVEARHQHGRPTAAGRASGPACCTCAGVSTTPTRCVRRSPSTGAIPPRRRGCSPGGP